MWGCLSCPESSGDLSLWWQWGSTAAVVVHTQWWAPMSGVGSNPTLSVHSWPVGRPATSREILTPTISVCCELLIINDSTQGSLRPWSLSSYSGTRKYWRYFGRRKFACLLMGILCNLYLEFQIFTQNTYGGVVLDTTTAKSRFTYKYIDTSRFSRTVPIFVLWIILPRNTWICGNIFQPIQKPIEQP